MRICHLLAPPVISMNLKKSPNANTTTKTTYDGDGSTPVETECNANMNQFVTTMSPAMTTSFARESMGVLGSIKSPYLIQKIKARIFLGKEAKQIKTAARISGIEATLHNQ